MDSRIPNPRSLSCILLASSAATAVQPAQSVTTAEDVALSASADLPVQVPRDERAERGAVQGERFVFLGASDHVLSGFDRLSVVGAASSTGELLWTWIDDQPFTTPLDLFVPGDGPAVFTLLERQQATLEVRRFEADGTVSWLVSFTTAFGGSDAASLAGARDGERLFLLSGALDEEGSGLDVLTALDPETGATSWTRPLPAETTQVAVATDAAGARVFTLVEAEQFNDRVVGFGGIEGELLWGVGVSTTFGQSSSVRLLACEPDGSRVYVGAHPDSPSGQPTVLALDSARGDVLWSAVVPGYAVAFAVDEPGPYLYVLSRSTPDGLLGPTLMRVTCLRAEVGGLVWSRVLPVAASGSSPIGLAHDALGGQVVVSYTTVGDADLLLALDAEDGDTRWQALEPHDGDVGGTGALGVLSTGDGTSVVRARRVDPDRSGEADLDVAAFAGADGAPEWNAAVAFESVTPAALGLAVDGAGASLFALVRDGGGLRTAAAFEREGLVPRWQQSLEADEFGFGTLGAGERLASTPDGSLACTSRIGSFSGDAPGLEGLDGATGTVLWSRAFPGSGNAADLLPAPAGSALYLIHDGDAQASGWPAVRAVDPATGADLWVQKWPGSLPIFGLHSRAGDLTPDGARVAALVSGPYPDFPSTTTLVVRSAADGALVQAKTLVAADFGIPLGNSSGLDVVLGSDGTAAFVLAEFLGSISYPPSFGMARVDAVTGAVTWGTELATGLFADLAPGEVHVTPDGARAAVVGRLRPSPGDERTYVAGVDARTGVIAWQALLGEPGAGRAFDEAVLDGSGRALVVSVRDTATGAARLAAFDVATGTLLWETVLASGSGADRIGALLASDGSILALAGADQVLPGGAASLTELVPEALVSGPDTVSIANPVHPVFLLDRPETSSGVLYLVLGSVSGTSPGLPVDGLEIPLVADFYLQLSIIGANQPPFIDTFGALDESGDARAALALTPGLPPELAGLALHHAFVELLGGVGVSFASEPVTLLLVP